MTITTVDMNRINNDRVAVYLASTDRRVTIGVRFALEALGLELPDFLRRGRPGPRPNRVNKMMAALDADTGNPNTYRHEKLEAVMDLEWCLIHPLLDEHLPQAVSV